MITRASLRPAGKRGKSEDGREQLNGAVDDAPSAHSLVFSPTRVLFDVKP
jgi:hypothetical protein